MLQVESGSGEKSTRSGGPKINGYDRIRILIPAGYKLEILFLVECVARTVETGRDAAAGGHRELRQASSGSGTG